MNQKKIEQLANYSVVIIALSALVVSIWQVKLFQNHNKLSVKPYLDFHLIQEDSTLTVSFSNEGLGPAIIKQISYNYDGNEFRSLENLLKADNEKKNVLLSFNYSRNSIISSGDEKLLVKLFDSETRGVKVKIVYETIYEERDEFNFSF